MKKFLVLVCAGALAHVQADAQELKGMDAIIQPLLADYPAVQVAVVRVNGSAYRKSYGYADWARKSPTDNSDLFRMYSVSKLVTTIALLQLVENGKLDPDKPVSDYLPPEVWNEPLINPWKTKITARHLAYHRSGIRHYSGTDEVYSAEACQSVSEAVSLFNQSYLLFEPGTKRSYSSWGFVLLSALIEKVSGLPFDRYIQQNVLDKAGLKSIQLYDRSDPVRLAGAYEKDANGMYRNVSYVDVSCKFGAGGYMANAEAMARLGMALFSGALISKDMVKLIVDGDVNEEGIYISGGVSAGGRSVLAINTKTGDCVAILGNQRGESFDPALKQIFELLR